MLKTGNETVDAIGQMNLEGNVIPHRWFDHIKFENGKPDLTAIIILSEIVYWYRPFYVKDEATGSLKGLKKRFKADMLQRSYDSFATQFGITKRQATEAIRRLEADNFVKRHFRTIEANGTRLNNVLFIELLHQNVIAMTFQCDTYPVETSGVSHSNVTPPTLKCETNTEITTEINNIVEKLDVVCEIIDYLNAKAQKNYRATSTATKRLINARLAEGYAVDDFKRVIDLKASQWANDAKWSKYLRPDTLFNATKFEAYLNEAPARKAEQVKQSYQPPVLNFSEGENFG